MRLGVHVSIAGGFSEALARAERLGCTAMQIFSRSPRGGAVPKIAKADADAFHAARQQSGIHPLSVHAPYIINLASPEEARWKWFAGAYCEEYERAVTLRADFLVTHVGSPKGQDEAAGIERVARAIDLALKSASGPTVILLENTAGSGQGLGCRFEQLHAIRAASRYPARVGICLDTAHLFAAGYPIHTAEGLDATLSEFDKTVGIEQIKLIHLNDSKVLFDSRVDRHWHIGEGHIGSDAFRRILNHPRLKSLSWILETPKDSDEEDLKNLAAVRGLCQKQPSAK